MKLNGVAETDGFSGVALFNKMKEQTKTTKKSDVAASSGRLQEDLGIKNEANGTNNMLADLFVHDEANTSRYVQANMDRLQQLGSMRQRQNAIVSQAQLNIAALPTTSTGRYAEVILEGRKAEEKTLQEKGTAVTENSEAVLEESRKDLEERVEEKLNESDENDTSVRDTETAENSAKDAESSSSSANDSLTEQGDSAQSAVTSEGQAASDTDATTHKRVDLTV